MLHFFSKNQRGFTLIELLVVIAIIGTLATMVLTSLNSARVKARDVARLSDLRQISLALALYYDDNADTGYPGTSGTNQWSTMESALETGKYISSVPSDPGTGTYEYWVAADNQSYVLNATLEDSNNPGLDDDLDGIILGCACDDPEYCIQL